MPSNILWMRSKRHQNSSMLTCSSADASQEVNRPEEAERVLRSTLDLRPNNGALLIQLGSALLDQAMALELSGATEKAWAKYAGAADELSVAIGRRHALCANVGETPA